MEYAIFVLKYLSKINNNFFFVIVLNFKTLIQKNTRIFFIKYYLLHNITIRFFIIYW